MLRTAIIAAIVCVSSHAHAGLDADKCKRLNDAVSSYGQAQVESFGPAYGYSLSQTRSAIKYCAKQFPKEK